MFKKLLFLSIVCLFFSCRKQFTPKDLEQTWFINDVEFMNSDANEVLKNPNLGIDISKLAASSIKARFKLVADGTLVTFEEGNYKLGKWQYDNANKVLSLTFPDSKSADDKMLIKLTKTKPTALDWEYTDYGQIWKMKVDTLYSGNGVDLLAPELNKWRVKPDHKETDAEIQQRLSGMIDFLEAYFSLVVYKKQNYFETITAHEPIRYFQNGLGLVTEDNIPEGYLAYFFDREDALKSIKMLEKLFGTIEFPSGNANYSEGYAKCYRLMKAQIRTGVLNN